MEVGSYAHRPIFHHPDDIPSNEAGGAVADRAAVHGRRLRPADGAGDRADGRARRRRDQVRHQRSALAHARRHAGARRDRRGAQPVVGGGGVDQGGPRHRPARRRVDDRTATRGCATRTRRTSAASTDHERTEHHVLARCAEHYNKTYGIVHPREQWASQRGMRRSPFFAREEALGAVFFDARGWERPQWYESNADLLDRYPQAVRAAAARVGRPLVVADHQRRAPPPARARRDGRPHARSTSSSIDGPGRRRLPATDVRQQRRRRRRALGVHAAADARRRLPRRPHDHAPRRASASASSPAPSTAAATSTGSAATCPPDGSVTFTDRTSALCTIGVWGPQAVATMTPIATDRSRRGHRSVARTGSRTARCATC